MGVYNPLIDLFSKVNLPYPGGNKVKKSQILSIIAYRGIAYRKAMSVCSE